VGPFACQCLFERVPVMHIAGSRRRATIAAA
jgi:hypothetical protein